MAMLDAETDRKLRVLGVPEMVVAYQEQTKSMDRVNQPLENRLAELVDAAYQAKYNEKVEHLLKAAHLRIPTADVTRILYDDKRPFSRELVDELATCHFVEQHTSLIIQGYPSSGKTYLSCAFAKEACKKHYKTAYIRMSDLLSADEESRMSRIREEKRLLRKYSQYQVLVIDEWLTTGVDEDEVRFLYELAERRFDSTSTIFTILYDKAEWLACLGEGALSELIIERFTHNVIVLKHWRERLPGSFRAPGSAISGLLRSNSQPKVALKNGIRGLIHGRHAPSTRQSMLHCSGIFNRSNGCYC